MRLLQLFLIVGLCVLVAACTGSNNAANSNNEQILELEAQQRAAEQQAQQEAQRAQEQAPPPVDYSGKAALRVQFDADAALDIASFSIIATQVRLFDENGNS